MTSPEQPVHCAELGVPYHIHCLYSRVRSWMNQNVLNLNNDKPEFLLICDNTKLINLKWCTNRRYLAILHARDIAVTVYSTLSKVPHTFPILAMPWSQYRYSTKVAAWRCHVEPGQFMLCSPPVKDTCDMWLLLCYVLLHLVTVVAKAKSKQTFYIILKCYYLLHKNLTCRVICIL